MPRPHFYDIHCHILPGLDDGPSTLEESLLMLEAARADGIAALAATPHVVEGGYENTRSGIEAGLDLLRTEAAGRGLIPPPELYAGAEGALSPNLKAKLLGGQVPTLGTGPYVLVEMPHYGLPPGQNLIGFFLELRKAGLRPVITHPERHPALAGNQRLLRELVAEGGALLQLTAMSITGDFGRKIQKASLAIVKKGLAHFVASDAHSPDRRPPRLGPAYDLLLKKFGEETARNLCSENPRRALEGQKPERV